MFLPLLKNKIVKNIIIDTNIILRFLLNDIPSQYEIAESMFLQAKKGKLNLIIPQIVIFEVAFMLEKQLKVKKKIQVEKIQTLLSANFLDIQDKTIFSSAIKLYEKFSLSLPDCFLIAKSQITGIPIFTFDKNLAKLSKEL